MKDAPEVSGAEENDTTKAFEEAALKKLGGSVAFVKGRKFIEFE